MKIEYPDGSYIEFVKINDAIQIAISASDMNNKKKMIVNSANINIKDFLKLVESLNKEVS